jgi:hypothetical protein
VILKAIMMALLFSAVLLALIGVLRRLFAKDTRFEAIQNPGNKHFEQ